MPISASTTVTSVGSYCWRADFTSFTSGVPNATHSGVGDSNECFTVGPVTPTLVTQASATVLLNTPISDTATLSGTAEQPGSPVIGGAVGSPAGGSIVFQLFGPNTGAVCGALVFTSAAFPVTGDNTYGPASFTPLSVGTYTWEATYTPDLSGNTNGASATTCPDPSGKENVTVTDTSSATSGQTWRPQDTATVVSTSGKPTLNGTLSIQLYEGSGCVDANKVSGQLYSQPVSSASTATVTSANNTYDVSVTKAVSWLVTFTSTDSNVTGTSHCENTSLTITN